MLRAQFTYATVPDPGPYSDANGWKVKQVLPLEDSLRRWVERATAPVGTFTPATIPLLAAPAEIAALPRRLRLDVLDGALVALLLQTSAGRSNDHRDSSFTHGLLVNRQDGAGIGGLRPAELWDSAGWLRPIGPEAVRAAVLLPEPDFGPAPAVPVEARWAADRNLALLLLSVLEAAHTAKPGAVSRIAVLDGTGAVTADWVGFLGRHLTPGAAWTAIPFSTNETAVEGRAAALADLRVIGIPPDEEPAARRTLGRDWLIIDPAVPVAAPTELPDGAGLGWELAGGRRVSVGAWAQLAERLTLLDEMGLGSIAELLDRISADTAGSSDDRPLWALPAALLATGGPAGQLLAQAMPDAVELVKAHYPPSLRVPAATKDALLGTVREYSAQPVEAFAQMLRSGDATGSGVSDPAVEGYLTALWGAGVDGGPPAWVTGTGPLPWLPQASPPSAELTDRLLAGLPGLLAWSGVLADDPDRTQPLAALRPGARPGELSAPARVRILACVHEVFARWGLADRPPVSTIVTGQLVSALLESMRAGQPAAAGSWPVLRPEIFDAVRAGLEAELGADRLAPPVLRWLDQQCGPVRVGDRAAVEGMSVLDLERARFEVMSAGSSLPPEAVALRAATVLRDAIAAGSGWQVLQWWDAVRFVLGAEPSLADARWLLGLAVARKLPVPAAGIGDQLVRRFPLDPAAAEFAQWLLGPPAATGQPDGRFPALAVQQACRPALPVNGEPAADPRWAGELAALAAMAGQPDCPLRESVLPRLAADILLVSAPSAVAGRWPWQGAGPAAALAASWAAGFDLLEAATDQVPARRLVLAGSLFVRSLIADQIAVQGIRVAVMDPAGAYLVSRRSSHSEDWRVEDLLHRLLSGVDRADKQQWVSQVRQEAIRSCAAVPGAPARLGAAVAEMVEQNAATMAFGALGARMPWGRGRPRAGEAAAGEAWDTWNR